MSKETRRQKILWLEHLFWMLGIWSLLAFALAAIALGSGLANPLLRHALISRVEGLTGGKVEIRTVSVGWFSLTATANGIVIHGKEPATTEPLFSAEQARIGLRIDSFWGRRVSLNELVLQQPQLHLRVEKNGASNLPVLNRASASQKPLQETLLNLRVHHVEIKDGWFLYNDLRSLVAVEGGDLRLDLSLAGTSDQPLYLANLDWNSIELARRRDYPIPANLSAKVTI